MKVFLSWSGDLSRSVAEVLREWLPCVIQSVEPYVSSEDMHKGERWAVDVAKELEDSQFGILCVTPDNLAAPWLHFEAGALSKHVDRSRVCPFLLGVRYSDLEDPLKQFQSALYERDDVAKLMRSLNSACDPSLPELVLESSFQKWWPDLQGRLGMLEATAATLGGKAAAAPAITQEQRDAILEEVLELVRGQHRLLRSPEELLPPGYVRSVIGRIGPSREHETRPTSEDMDPRTVGLSGERAAQLWQVLDRLAHLPGKLPEVIVPGSFLDVVLDEAGLVSRNGDFVGMTRFGAEVFSQLGSMAKSSDLRTLSRVFLSPKTGRIRFQM